MRAMRIIVWALLMVLCAGAFVRTGAVALLVAAISLVAIPVAGWVAASVAAPVVSLASVSSAAKGVGVQLGVRVDNGSLLPFACIRMRVRATNLLTAESEDAVVFAAVAPRSAAQTQVVLTSDLCGRVECRIVEVRVFDMFRLFGRSTLYKRKSDTEGAVCRFTVMPTLHDAFLRNVRAAAPLSDTTVFSPYLRGSDLSEVFGLREYENGDELRRIHWKLSEKSDQLIVREPSLPLDNALLLFWDKSAPGMRDAHAGAQAADAAAEVVLALMEQLTHAGVSFEVASNDTASGRCLRSFVTDEGDIYELIGQLLSSAPDPDAEPGLDGYVRLFGGFTCSRLIFVGFASPLVAGKAFSAADVLAFVCDPMAADAPAADVVRVGDGVEVRFSSASASEALRLAGMV